MSKTKPSLENLVKNISIKHLRITPFSVTAKMNAKLCLLVSKLNYSYVYEEPMKICYLMYKWNLT